MKTSIRYQVQWMVLKKIIKRNKNIVIILNKLKCIILYIRLKYK